MLNSDFLQRNTDYWRGSWLTAPQLNICSLWCFDRKPIKTLLAVTGVDLADWTYWHAASKTNRGALFHPTGGLTDGNKRLRTNNEKLRQKAGREIDFRWAILVSGAFQHWITEFTSSKSCDCWGCYHFTKQEVNLSFLWVCRSGRPPAQSVRILQPGNL